MGFENAVWPRKIHKADAATTARLPASVKTRCEPGITRRGRRPAWCVQPPHCARPPLGAKGCTAPPRRARSLRSSRTGWPHPVRTGIHQSSCQHAHGGQFRGRISGGRHRRSWGISSKGLQYGKPIINANCLHLQSYSLIRISGSGNAEGVPSLSGVMARCTCPASMLAVADGLIAPVRVVATSVQSAHLCGCGPRQRSHVEVASTVVALKPSDQ
jgi:hypothetical protein